MENKEHYRQFRGYSYEDLMKVDPKTATNESDAFLLSILQTQRGQDPDNVNYAGFYIQVYFEYNGNEYRADVANHKLMTRPANSPDAEWKEMEPHTTKGPYTSYFFGLSRIHTHRAIAALFIPGACFKLLTTDLVINHKAAFIDGFTKARFLGIREVYDEAKKLMRVLKKTHPSWKQDRLLDEIAKFLILKRELVTTDGWRLLRQLTDDFRHVPVYPRYEDPSNLELVTEAENLSHARVVSKLIATSDVLNVFELDKRMIPASICADYEAGRLSFEDLIYLVNECSSAPHILPDLSF